MFNIGLLLLNNVCKRVAYFNLKNIVAVHCLAPTCYCVYIGAQNETQCF